MRIERQAPAAVQKRLTRRKPSKRYRYYGGAWRDTGTGEYAGWPKVKLSRQNRRNALSKRRKPKRPRGKAKPRPAPQKASQGLWTPSRKCDWIFIDWPWHIENPTAQTLDGFRRSGVDIAPPSMTQDDLDRIKRQRSQVNATYVEAMAVDRPHERTVVLYRQSVACVEAVAGQVLEEGTVGFKKDSAGRMRNTKGKFVSRELVQRTTDDRKRGKHIGKYGHDYVVMDVYCFEFKTIKGVISTGKLEGLLSVLSGARWFNVFARKGSKVKKKVKRQAKPRKAKRKKRR